MGTRTFTQEQLDKRAAYMREYQKTNKEKLRAYLKEWRAKRRAA